MATPLYSLTGTDRIRSLVAHNSTVAWWRPLGRRAPLALAALFLLAHAAPAGAACDDANDAGCAYAGLLAGSSRAFNRIVDVDGFANWGNPGSALDYDDVELTGSALVGRRLGIGPVPLRIEADATFGDMRASTNMLDPQGLDETAAAKIRWIVTAAAGSDFTIGRFTVFGKGGLAVADVDNSVTDIDFFRDMPPTMDPDDSFREISTDFGWQVAAGVEAEFAGAWALRLDASYMALGQSTYAVNRGRNNRCGPGGPHRPCLYEVEHTLGLLRLGFVYRFGG